MLQLIRYKNLIFTFIIQWLIYYAIINPIILSYSVAPLLPAWVLGGIILSTLLIAAGGYVINDYFDLKIDRINRPERVIVGEKISKERAMLLYRILTIAGALVGVGMAYVVKSLTLGILILMSIGLLWFYSASYKRQFIVGNLIVAIVAACVPLLPLIAESALLTQEYRDLIRMTPIPSTLYAWVCGFALFAFLWTLIREIIKDMEDIEGDSEMECRTIPIVCGMTMAKIIVTALTVITVLLVGAAAYFLIQLPGSESATMRYWLIGIVLPAICLLVILWRKAPNAYHNASTIVKFIMAVGILYSLVFYYFTAKASGLLFFGLFAIPK